MFSCYRECTNIAVAKDEKDCDMEEKKVFETSRGCEKKCSKTKPEPECGADTNYYDNKYEKTAEINTTFMIFRDKLQQVLEGMLRGQVGR